MFVSLKSSVAIVLCLVAIATVAHAEDAAAQLMRSIDDLDQEQTLPLFGGLSVERVANAAASSARSGSESLVERAGRYLQTHQVQFSLHEQDGADVAGEFHRFFGESGFAFHAYLSCESRSQIRQRIIELGRTG